MSLLKPGLGQMYNGQLRKGILFSLLISLLTLLGVIFVGMYSESRILNVVSLFMIPLLSFLAACEALFYSKKIGKEFETRKYNRWYYYVTFFIVASFVIQKPIAVFIKEGFIHAYKITTGAMENTVLLGDFLLANHNAYKSNRLPQKEDIVIFNHFGVDKKHYIKRVVATSGEKVTIVGKEVFLDEVKQTPPAGAKYIHNGINPGFPDTFEIYIPSPDDKIEIADLSFMDFLFLYHIAKQENERAVAEINMYISGDPVQTIPLSLVDNWLTLQKHINKLKQNVNDSLVEFKNNLVISGMDVTEYRVKNHNFFIMGDNRDNSFDSRHFGCVNLNSIKGKAKFVYFSIQVKASLFNLLGKIRWNRIGKKVE